MAEVVPKALILGHSFVTRLKHDLDSGFDPRAASDFNLRGTASVYLHGVGGRTMQTLQEITFTWSETLLQISLCWK